jgi:hypothetical protein
VSFWLSIASQVHDLKDETLSYEQYLRLDAHLSFVIGADQNLALNRIRVMDRRPLVTTESKIPDEGEAVFASDCNEYCVPRI